MKKVILTMLTVLMLIVPAYAVEDDPAMDQPIQQEQEKEPVVVDSLEGLQAAIDAVEDGDTIAISQEIQLTDQILTTDKQINLIRSAEYNGNIFSINNGAIIDNFTFLADRYDTSGLIWVDTATSEAVNIRNCIFKSTIDELTRFVNIYGGLFSDNIVYLEKCQFFNSSYGAISIKAHTDVVIDSCDFIDCNGVLPGGAVSSSGKLFIKDTSITGGSSASGSVFSSGELIITNSKICGKFSDNPEYGGDIYCIGKLTITDEQKEDVGFYEKTTGEKIELPLVDCDGHFNLFYLTTDQAAEYFAPELPTEETQQPEPGYNDSDEDNPPEKPQEPGDQTGNNDATGEDQSPQESPQPSEDEGPNDPTNSPPEDTEKPAELPQVPSYQDKDNPTDNTQDKPREPDNSDSDDDDGYTPSSDYRPSQRSTGATTNTTKPVETNQPQEQPNTSAPVKPQLACNGAIIDTSKTVVLLGYADRPLHEDEPLTRAQLSAIVYRLLDAESIARYNDADLTFTDIPADAWYVPYVKIIQAAGIVNGVGGGRYDPEGVVSWAQIVTILTRFVEPQDYSLQYIQYGGWATQAIQTAVALEWIEDSADFDPDAVIGGAELTQLVNDVLALYR